MKTKKKKNKIGVSIDQLLAAPLVAAAKANSSMAKMQTSFLLESCFDFIYDDELEEGGYHPKLITMTMTKNVIKPETVKSSKPKMEQLSTSFQIPILTLIPFNSLTVKDLVVKFDLDILSHNLNVKQSDLKKESDEVLLRAEVSYDSHQKRKEQYNLTKSSKLAVEMTAGSIPLPVGFTTILDLYTKNINSSSIEKTNKPKRND